MRKLLEVLPPVVLGLAGVAKLWTLPELAAVVGALGILPSGIAPIVACSVVVIEFVVAGAFISGFRRVAYALCVLMFSLFVSFHVWNLAHGISAPCHCVGTLLSIPSWLGAIIASTLLALSAAQLSAANPQYNVRRL